MKRETITVDKFIEVWDEELSVMKNDLRAFADNLRDIGDESFIFWIKAWIAWNELASTKDIENYYSNRFVFTERKDDSK